MRRRLSVFLMLVIVVTLCMHCLPSCTNRERVYRQGNFEYTVEDNEVTIKRYKGQSADVIIPSTIKEMPVVAIGDSAFHFCDKMKTLTIPDSVIRIEYSVFNECYALERVNLGRGIRELDSDFSDCRNMIYNEYENGYYIGNEENPYLAFVRPMSQSIETVTIHPDTVVVCGCALDRCNRLREASFPECVVSLGAFAMQYCNSLERVYIPKSLESIGTLAFNSCDSILEIAVSEENPHFKSVDGSLFSRDGTKLIKYAAAQKVSSYRVPDGTVTIQDSAFERALYLTDVVFPDSVETIGHGGFIHCENLHSIQLGNGLKTIGGQAFGYTALTAVTIPDSVEELSYSIFSSCDKLESVVIGRGVSFIHDGILTDCGSLKEVVFLDPTGWKSAHRYHRFRPVDVSDPKQNAVYFTDTHAKHYWSKK